MLFECSLGHTTDESPKTNPIKFEKTNNVQSKSGVKEVQTPIGLVAGRSLLWALHAPFGAPGGYSGKPCVTVRWFTPVGKCPHASPWASKKALGGSGPDQSRLLLIQSAGLLLLR